MDVEAPISILNQPSSINLELKSTSLAKLELKLVMNLYKAELKSYTLFLRCL